MVEDQVLQPLAHADFETRRKSERHTALLLYERLFTALENIIAACQDLPTEAAVNAADKRMAAYRDCAFKR